MNKNLVTHLIAIVFFTLSSALYYASEFKGKSIQSHDMVSYVGSSKELKDYQEKGEQILWTSRVFSGMPTYFVSNPITWNVLQRVNDIRHALPTGFGLSIGLMLGFYIACLILGLGATASVPIALVFGFSSWFLQSIEAWHVTKITAISYMVPLLASVVMGFRGKIWLGGALTALFLSLLIGAAHLQIVYYTLFFTLAIATHYLIRSVKEKKLNNVIRTGIILIGFAVLGVLPNTATLLSTYDYSKESMRGGKSEISHSAQANSEGLDFDYAMRWSYGKLESFNLLVPGLYAGGYSPGENSYTVQALKKMGVPDKAAMEYARGLPMYYGDQPFTSGPTYLGASILFLFLLLFFLNNNGIKFALLSAFILSLFFSWGLHFEVWNKTFFENFPFFNKFRAPSMWLTLAIVSSGLGAVLTLKNILNREYDSKTIHRSLYATLGIMGGLCLFIYLFGATLVGDFTGSYDDQLRQNGFPVDAMIEDRMALLKSDALRSLFFVVLTAGAIWLWIRNSKMKLMLMSGAVGMILVLDVVPIGKRYLNENDFVTEKKSSSLIPPTSATQTILSDPDQHFRVFNMSVDPFNDNTTSYYHQSVGGYSAVKLFRYQDLIDFHLSKGNQKVFDMLNTRYMIQGNPGEERAVMSPGALGNAWFVDSVIWAENADEEIDLLNSFSPEKNVVIDRRFEDKLTRKLFNSEGSSIEMSNYHPEKLTYTANCTNVSFAVFSEIWYKGNVDWKAYIDGKEVEFIRVNYLLRGMEIPQGKHEIVFEFRPKLFYLGNTISLAGSIIILLILAGVLIKESKTKKA